jgi:hypothetical protein
MILIAIEDITERKRAEEKFLASEDGCRTLVEQVKDLAKGQAYFAHSLFPIIMCGLAPLGCVFNHANSRVVMDTPSPFIRDLARRLLAVEAASQSAADPRVHEAVRVFEKLRVSLTRFAGAGGYTALMRRALALARVEIPALHSITEKADGSLDGLDTLAADERALAVDAAVAITAHLLGLLVTLIGQPLTTRLVREGWPNASLAK